VLATLGSAALLAATLAPIAASADTTPALPDGVTSTTPPLSPATAAAQAGTAYQQHASTAGAVVPLVTVETTSTGPKIVSTPVRSQAQARAVATDAAHGDDLVVVKADSLVTPVSAPTNDLYTHAGDQWGIDTAKTTFANAWRLSTGRGVTVAVVDTGVDATNPDLAGQVLPGKAFLTGVTNATVLNPKIDTCGHGTHVAGTIAALANNRIGVAGAAPAAKILPVKVMNPALGCSGYSSDVANGIRWAANNGAKVVNLSLGGTVRDPAQDLAIAYARSKGVVVVAAAGNNHGPASCGSPNTNAVSYPGASPGVIAVGAIDATFARACFSNTGSYVDVVGPGVMVLSTYPVALTPKGNVPYVYMSGTSMATPHVAAAAALLLSRFPSCTPDQVTSRLESTARRLGGTTRNNDYGYGLIDPARAVTAC
jgi:type VII secretion-associated serine protease mycosin